MADFGEFYLGSKDRVFRTVLAATGDRSGAEDAVAEAFSRAYARWTHVQDHPNPVGWVITVAFNAHRSWWRRLRRELLHGSAPDQPISEYADELSDRVQHAVRQLPRRQRETVALRVLSGFTAEETAELLGISPATVHVHLHRALAMLRTNLDLVRSDSITAKEVAR